MKYKLQEPKEFEFIRKILEQNHPTADDPVDDSWIESTLATVLGAPIQGVFLKFPYRITSSTHGHNNTNCGAVFGTVRNPDEYGFTCQVVPPWEKPTMDKSGFFIMAQVLYEFGPLFYEDRDYPFFLGLIKFTEGPWSGTSTYKIARFCDAIYDDAVAVIHGRGPGYLDTRTCVPLFLDRNGNSLREQGIPVHEGLRNIAILQGVPT